MLNVRPVETPGDYTGLWPKFEPWVSKQASPVSQGNPPTQTAAPVRADSERKEPAKPEISWEEASQSGDIVKYAGYLKAHPKEHLPEIRALVDKFLRDKVAEAEGQGKKVLHNATSIQADVGGGTTFWLGGGKIELGPALWFSDPTNVLAVRALNGFQYVKGKGLGIMGDKVYCFGF